MAKEIVWSARAKEDRRKILEYWQQRNKSIRYSEKLFDLFQLAVNQLRENPAIGKPTSMMEIRAYIIKDYIIFYESTTDHLLIHTIWDSRRDPAKLKI